MVKKGRPRTHYDTHKWCPDCDEKRPVEEFYWNKKARNYSTRCKYHRGLRNKGSTKKHCRKRKIRYVAYKGGACAICGIVDSPEIYDFHHVDPSKKVFNLGSGMAIPLRDEWRVFEELDKCIMLCANCHRKLHAGSIEI